MRDDGAIIVHLVEIRQREWGNCWLGRDIISK